MIDDPTAAPDRSPSVQLDPAAKPPVILLEQKVSWADIRDDARTVIEPVSAAWAGAEAHLDLGLREPDLFDLRRLVHMLKDDFDINIVGLRCLDDSLRRFAERELKVRLHLWSPEPEPQDGADEQPPEEPETSEGLGSPELGTAPETTADRDLDTASETLGASGYPVRVVQRTLRGGKVLRHSGDIVLYGNVNPGAQVIAGGSITVLGSLEGMAHAGTRSGDSGWILALSMEPTQLRIGQHITISEPSRARARGTRKPEIASVRDGDVSIEPYRGRVPRNDNRRSDA